MGALFLAACGGAAPSTDGRAVGTGSSPPAATAIRTPAPTADAPPTAPPTTPPTQGLIEFFAARVAEEPDDGEAQLQLGFALLQWTASGGPVILLGR